MAKRKISNNTKKTVLAALNLYCSKLEKFYKRTKGKNLSEQEVSVLETTFQNINTAIQEIDSMENI